MTNAEFSRFNVVFLRACSLAGTPPTRRQASKWRLEKGSAFAKKRVAAALVEHEQKDRAAS